MQVMLRHFNRETDQHFVYASWSTGVFFSRAKNLKGKKKQAYFKALYEHLAPFMEQPGSITIACLAQAPNTILGFMVRDQYTLHWVYVKMDYRNQRIATLMVNSAPIEGVDMTYISPLGASLMKKLDLEGETDHASSP